MLRHVVMFRWSDSATPATVDAVAAGLAGLPAAIPEIADYRFGSDAGINDGNWDFVVTADFATVDDYLVYRDHPEHQRVIADHIRPVLAERAAVQFEA